MDNDIAKLYDQWRDTLEEKERQTADYFVFALTEELQRDPDNHHALSVAKTTLVYALLYKDKPLTRFGAQG